jgi:hypothetical protein
MTRKPKFITFTGVDGRTNLDACRALSWQYPVEFAFLHSVSKGNYGKPRYTGMHYLPRLAGMGVSCAVHLCGSSAKAAMSRSSYLEEHTKFAQRIQINARDEDYPVLDHMGALHTTIRQTRDTTAWPETPNWVFPLLDCSGGRGKLVTDWPASPPTKMVGYAGGLAPRLVAGFLERLPDHPHGFWIDMESGVRTVDGLGEDWFDIEKCRKVCEEVYER